MSDEFYCPNCRKYKPLTLRSNKKASSTYVCISCNDKLSKKLNPQGKLSHLTQEQKEAGRVNQREKKGKDNPYKMFRDVDALSRKLKGI